MLYISGPNDLPELIFCFSKYGNPRKTYQELNPELNALYPGATCIPPYMPVFLVQQDNPSERAKVVNMFKELSIEERKTLRAMQESRCNIVTQVAMTQLMKELQHYAKNSREWLKQPIITTPWTEFNKSFTNKSLIKLCGEFLQQGERLYEDMMKCDVLKRQLHLLQHSIKEMSNEVLALARELAKRIEELTARIKVLLPKKLTELKDTLVRNVFTSTNINKLSSYEVYITNDKIKLFVTEIDQLNQKGLDLLKQMIKGLKTIEQQPTIITKLINYATVAYDTVEAYTTSGGIDAMKILLTSAGAIYITNQVVAAVGGTTALGGIVISSLTGDLAIGATILASSPFWGWIALIVVGVAAAGYVTYKAKGRLEEIWDLSVGAFGWLYNYIKGCFEQKEKDLFKELDGMNIEKNRTFRAPVFPLLVKSLPQNSQWMLDLYHCA